MRMQINWNAVTAVCAIIVALLTASGWLTDGLREDIRDLRLEMREGFGGMRLEMREEFGGMRQEMAGMRQEMAGMRQEMREDIKDLRLEMREGFAETREDIEALQQDVAFIKGQTRSDQTTNGNARRRDSGK